jgi:hypothetical protein
METCKAHFQALSFSNTRIAYVTEDRSNRVLDRMISIKRAPAILKTAEISTSMKKGAAAEICYHKYEGLDSMDNLDHWPSDFLAISLLSTTIFAK